MRHRVKTNTLKLTDSHRLALYRNQAINMFTWGPAEIEAKSKQGLKEVNQPYRHYNKPYQIKTSLKKAKATQSFIEKCITLAKKAVAAEKTENPKDKNLLHRRRLIAMLGGNLTAKRIAKKLIEEIAPKYATRQGGYTRIIRLPKLVRMVRLENHLSAGKKRSKFLGSKLGDNTSLCIFELVEFDGEERKPAMDKLLPESVQKAQEEKEAAKGKSAPAKA
jgi:large subunit ribosomal protein L17